MSFVEPVSVQMIIILLASQVIVPSRPDWACGSSLLLELVCGQGKFYTLLCEKIKTFLVFLLPFVWFRHTVQHVSDHWLNYRSWRRDVCHDSEEDIPNMEPHGTQLPLGKLQVEFDEFFFRATQYIMSAPR